MLGTLGRDPHCPIARSLDVLGEKWTLLVVREAHLGATRFNDFHAALGIPRDVLTARLASLVDGGVLERRPYREPGERARDEYVLTAAGRDLALVLLALGEWGARHRPATAEPPVRFADVATGEYATAAAVVGERVLAGRDLVATRV